MDLGVMAIMGYSYSLKLQYYWSLAIRLFSVISRTPVGGGPTPPRQRYSWCILQPPQLTGLYYADNGNKAVYASFGVVTNICVNSPFVNNASYKADI